MSSQNIVLHVRGMTCSSCVRHIDVALRRVPGVSSVHVDLATGEVRVEHDMDRASREELSAAILEAGY